MTDKAKLKKLKELKVVADLALNNELQQLAARKRAEDALRDRLAELTEKTERLSAMAASGAFDVSALADMSKWQAWASKQKRATLEELARLTSYKEEQLTRTRHAFGKTDALENLSKKR